MTSSAPPHANGSPDVGHVRVHYWAAARAAAGAAYDDLPVTGPTTLAAVTAAVLERRDDPRMRQVIGVCSVLVDDRPAGSADPARVVVAPGDSVQFLPPFAGG